MLKKLRTHPVNASLLLFQGLQLGKALLAKRMLHRTGFPLRRLLIDARLRQ